MEQQPDILHHTPSLLDEDEEEEDEIGERVVLTAVADLATSMALSSPQQWNQAELREKNEALRHRLKKLRADRHRIWEQQQRCNTLKENLMHTLVGVSTYQQLQALCEWSSARAENQALQGALESAQQWNVTASDAFYITCEHGTVATINGLRLGAESSSTIHNSTTTMTQKHVTHTIPFFSFGTAKTASETTMAPHKIPWREINAALGQVALLLNTLEQSLTTTINNNSSNKRPAFLYEIQAMGSTSKIGLRRPNNAATSFYNLYFAEDTFQFFGKRNFNTALQMLLECIDNISVIVQERDRTIVMPYPVHKRSHTIGGLNIHYFVGEDRNNNSYSDPHQHAAEWTRACKYLLTNVKHCMVFRAVGLWTTNPPAPTTAR